MTYTRFACPRLDPAHRATGRRVALLTVLVLLAGCGAAKDTQAAGDPDVPAGTAAATSPYQTGRASRDGIGKFYMGREISHVMGHRGAAWLERVSREDDERTDLLVANLPLTVDSVVADIGAGTGYFSFRLAKRVPEGRVLAVDIQSEMLALIRQRQSKGVGANVETILGDDDDPGLPPASVDVALIVDAYHEFEWPREMARGIARALKPGGRLVLIEYRAEDPSVPIKPLHKMTEAQAIAEITAAGLVWERTDDFLPQQHFLVFRRPPAPHAP